MTCRFVRERNSFFGLGSLYHTCSADPAHETEISDKDFVKKVCYGAFPTCPTYAGIIAAARTTSGTDTTKK